MRNKDEFTFGIFGAGIVGMAAKQYFKDAKIYDKFKDLDSFEETAKQDVLLLCLPTKFDIDKNETDLSAFYETLDKIPKGRIILVKSTVPIGTCNKLQQRYKNLIILHNPEFLTKAYAYEDYSFPDKQIIGMTKSNQKILARRLMVDLPYGHRLITTAKTSELLKYTMNNFYAMKVAFANQIYDLANQSDAYYDDILKGFIFDKRANPNHLEVNHNGYKGYGGMCLPKDVKELIRYARSKRCDLTIMETVDKYNDNLVDQKNVKNVT